MKAPASANGRSRGKRRSRIPRPSCDSPDSNAENIDGDWAKAHVAAVGGGAGPSCSGKKIAARSSRPFQDVTNKKKGALTPSASNNVQRHPICPATTCHDGAQSGIQIAKDEKKTSIIPSIASSKSIVQDPTLLSTACHGGSGTSVNAIALSSSPLEDVAMASTKPTVQKPIALAPVFHGKGKAKEISGGTPSISSTASTSAAVKKKKAITWSAKDTTVHHAPAVSSASAKKIAGSAPVTTSRLSSRPVNKTTSTKPVPLTSACSGPARSSVAPIPSRPLHSNNKSSNASSKSREQALSRIQDWRSRGQESAFGWPIADKGEAEYMEVFKSGTIDRNKVRAWVAKSRRRTKAYLGGDIAAIRKVESSPLEDYMGKSYQDDDDSRHEDYSEKDDYDYDQVYESDLEGEDGGFLCSVICDFLCDLPSSSNQLWDNDEITHKVLAACDECHVVGSRCTRDFRFEKVVRYAKDMVPLGEDIVNIDVRGLYSEEAKRRLRLHLFRLSHQQPYPKHLNVIVGCTLHGFGEGRLRQTVIDLLKVYNTLKWTEMCKGSIICINLEESLGWTTYDFVVADEETDLEEVVEAKEKLHLCIVILDFLCNLPTDHRQDPNITAKVLAALHSCCGDDDPDLDENTVVVNFDARGLYYVDVEKMLMDYLYSLSSQSSIKYLNVMVGCKVHGIGKAHEVGRSNLWATVARILMRDPSIKWVVYDSGAVISIELHPGKDYSSIELDPRMDNSRL